MACRPLRQWSQDRPPVRRYPALAQVAGRLRRDHQILNHKWFVAFENRSWRNLDPDHCVFDFYPRRDLAPARLLPRLPRLRRRGAFLHTARLDVRAALQTFQPGDLFVLFGDRLLQGGDFTEQSNQQSFKLWPGQRGKGGRRRHMMQRIHRAESTQGKNEGVPTLLPLLRKVFTTGASCATRRLRFWLVPVARRELKLPWGDRRRRNPSAAMG